VQFIRLGALSPLVGLKVDFDLQMVLMASSLYRLLAARIGREYQQATAKKIFRNLLDGSAPLGVQKGEVVVRLDRRANKPYLVASKLADEPTRCPGSAGNGWPSAVPDTKNSFC
jgi:hypothetical protein